MLVNGFAQHYRDQSREVLAIRDARLYATWCFLVDQSQYQSRGATFEGNAITLDPGDVRTRLRGMAHQLGMSVSTLRQKLHMLVVMGKITFRTAWDGIIVKVVHLAERIKVSKFMSTVRRTPVLNQNGYISKEDLRKNPKRDFFKFSDSKPWVPEIIETAAGLPAETAELLRRFKSGH